MTSVTLEMICMKTGKSIFRDIHISNICVAANCALEFEHNTIAEKSEQKQLLNNWIIERGNEQHNTELALINWTIN